MNCQNCHTPARHVAGQVYWCEPCHRNLLQRDSRADVMECGSCGAWLPNGKRHGHGLCLNSRSRKDETSAGDTCAYWEAI